MKKLRLDDEVKLSSIKIEENGISIYELNVRTSVKSVSSALKKLSPDIYFCYRRYMFVAITEDGEVFSLTSSFANTHETEMLLRELLIKYRKKNSLLSDQTEEQSITIKEIIAMVDL
jgi:Mn-dependent DtxR family transcriptional regulator